MKMSAGFKLLKSSLEKFRIKTQVFSDSEVNAILNGEQVLGDCNENGLLRAFISRVWEIKEKTIYKLTNSFKFSLVCFCINNRLGERRTVVIGPFCYEHLSSERIFELCEKNNLPPAQSNLLEKLCSFLPVLNKDSHLFYTLESYCENVWKTTDYSVIEMDSSPLEKTEDKALLGEAEKDVSMAEIHLLEDLYSYENKLIDAVSQGQLNLISQYTNLFSSTSFKQRQPDLLRDMKNYCIISNTLMRKAAEKGGVHPFFIDKLSTTFALRIERLVSANECVLMLKQIAYEYCKAVCEHKTENFSPIVEKTVIYIWNNLSEPLTLSTIAKVQSVSKEYLSSIFKKETGKTLTAFIRNARIENAIKLLKSTNLQIQTISHLCGILDFQYFSKQFKKVTGKTPKEYR